MIVARLFGGAGNQLFQYAAGRALADRLGVDLALDRRYVGRTGQPRADAFVHFRNARFTEASRLPPAKMDGLLRYGLWRLFGRNPRFHREAGLGFNPRFFDLPDNTYLHGYWQSPRYFGRSDARLRDDLAMTTPLDAANADMAARIAAAPVSVSVHVRRGDYVGDGAFAACTPGYYRTAIDHVAGRVGQAPTCFVFSNDPGWARENLSLGHETVIVDLNDEKAGHFDMYLQSLCDHNIIANSTFSWWGAWLNATSGRIVVAPKAWFGPGKPGNPDLCPPDWLRL
ncbi:MAG: alpha-1,2-fucosyltransferase [Roseovarius sp.]|nr:alpha-1,2-fucosyltransferase [Roseovarius sp.]